MGRLTPDEVKLIQTFADRKGVEVVVVGSRAAGTAGPRSDFDYLIGGNSRTRYDARRVLPRGIAGGEANASGMETGIDVFNANKVQLDRSKPHIIFQPNA